MADVEPVVLHLHLVVEGAYASVLLQDGREVNRHLLLLCAIAVTAIACRDGGLRACGELRNGSSLGTVLEGERLRGRDGPRQIPRLADGFVIDKLALLKRDSVVIDAHHHALTSVLWVHLRHLRRRLGRPIVLIGVFASGHRVEILERRGADAGEAALPEVAVVVERRVGMAGERDGVGVLAQQSRHRSIVATPSPRAVAGVLGVRVLNIEEGLAVGSQFGIMLFEEVREAGNVVLVLPMCTDEVVALDGLHPDGLIVFLEASLPCGRGLPSDALCLCRLSTHAADGSAPGVALHVVVAIDEELNRLLAVESFVVRKDLEPSICHDLQLRQESLIGHVAGDDDTIHLQTAEILEGVDECRGCVGSTEMDVADDADYEVRLTQCRDGLSQSWCTQISCSGKNGGALQEFSSVHYRYAVMCIIMPQKYKKILNTTLF